MNKQTTRNVLVVLGLWTFSRMVDWVLNALLIVVNNRLTFMGDVVIVTMWLWEGIPNDAVAALAAITLVWVLESRTPLAWVSTLAALYLYGEGLNAWRLLTHGWRTLPRTADYIGILTQAIIPALTCLAIGVWRNRRFATARQSTL